MKGKEKKQHEAKKIEALGGQAAKNRSMPYNILMGIKKKAVVREQKQDELVRWLCYHAFASGATRSSIVACMMRHHVTEQAIRRG